MKKKQNKDAGALQTGPKRQNLEGSSGNGKIAIEELQTSNNACQGEACAG